MAVSFSVFPAVHVNRAGAGLCCHNPLLGPLLRHLLNVVEASSSIPVHSQPPHHIPDSTVTVKGLRIRHHVVCSEGGQVRRTDRDSDERGTWRMTGAIDPFIAKMSGVDLCCGPIPGIAGWGTRGERSDRGGWQGSLSPHRERCTDSSQTPEQPRAHSEWSHPR